MPSRPVAAQIRFRPKGVAGTRFFGFLAAIFAQLLPALIWAESRVVVISPHHEAIRYEFGRAFAAWHAEKYREPAEVDWRDMGGSTDDLRFVLSEFARKPDGIGIDCFFGGGEEPFLQLADKRFLTPYQVPGPILDGIPRLCGGVEVYDSRHLWFGAAFSSFGILQNLRVEKTIGLPAIGRWEDLIRTNLFGWVGAGDPRNSGTMNTMFETILQAFGWNRGWQVLTALAGNVRKFDRVSSNTAKDVTLGETAYGLAIDFYAFTQVATAGKSNLNFVLPQDATVLNIDGIAILKGAPNLATAQHFLEFVLDEPGQNLWFLPRGHPQGPQKFSIERMSVRPEQYRRYRQVSNVEYSPYDLPQTFHYNTQLARTRREVVAALIGALLVDSHQELKLTWHHLIARGDATRLLPELATTPITESDAVSLAEGPWKNPLIRNQKKIDWQKWAQAKYQHLDRP
jgi:iron(III) transport system substrate-binding protein